MTTPVLNNETAAAYVVAFHGRFDQVATVNRTVEKAEDCGPAIDVFATLADGSAVHWTVWVEAGRLYGEY